MQPSISDYFSIDSQLQKSYKYNQYLTKTLETLQNQIETARAAHQNKLIAQSNPKSLQAKTKTIDKQILMAQNQLKKYSPINIQQLLKYLLDSTIQKNKIIYKQQLKTIQQLNNTLNTYNQPLLKIQFQQVEQYKYEIKNLKKKLQLLTKTKHVTDKVFNQKRSESTKIKQSNKSTIVIKQLHQQQKSIDNKKIEQLSLLKNLITFYEKQQNNLKNQITLLQQSKKVQEKQILATDSEIANYQAKIQQLKKKKSKHNSPKPFQKKITISLKDQKNQLQKTIKIVQ